MKLSNQFDRLAADINEDGGFSHKVAGPGAGTEARNSYMVGQGGHDFAPGTVTAEQLRSFSVANYDRLSAPDMYLGGWQAKAPARAAVEPSRAYPRGQRGSLSRAKLDAASTNQQAIGLTGSDGYEGDIENPNYVAYRVTEDSAKITEVGHGKRALTIKDAAWAFPQSTGPKAASSRQVKVPRR